MACELNIFSSGSPYGLLAQCSFIKWMVGCTIITFLAVYFVQDIDMWCLRWPFEIKPGKSDAVADTDSEREGVFWLSYLHALNTLLECSIQVQCSWKKRCDPVSRGCRRLRWTGDDVAAAGWRCWCPLRALLEGRRCCTCWSAFAGPWRTQWGAQSDCENGWLIQQWLWWISQVVRGWWQYRAGTRLLVEVWLARRRNVFIDICEFDGSKIFQTSCLPTQVYCDPILLLAILSTMFTVILSYTGATANIIS